MKTKKHKKYKGQSKVIAVGVGKRKAYVDYNTAKRLKGLDFDRHICPYFDEEGVLHAKPIGFIRAQAFDYNARLDSVCSAPRWSTVADWLRRQFHIFATAIPTEEGYYKARIIFENPYRVDDIADYQFYDEALARSCKNAIDLLVERLKNERLNNPLFA